MSLVSDTSVSTVTNALDAALKKVSEGLDRPEGSISSGSTGFDSSSFYSGATDPDREARKKDETGGKEDKLFVRSQALKAHQSRKLRTQIKNAERFQMTSDTATILEKRQDSQISKAIAELVRCPSLPLLVDDPSEKKLGKSKSSRPKLSPRSAMSSRRASMNPMNSNSRRASLSRGLSACSQASNHSDATDVKLRHNATRVQDYGLYNDLDMGDKPSMSRGNSNSSMNSYSSSVPPFSRQGSNMSRGSVDGGPSQSSLKSNNSLPSLLSKSGAHFGTLREGFDENADQDDLAEGSGSGIYSQLVGLTRRNGPQTESDEDFQRTQAEKGITTKYNRHLIEGKGNGNGNEKGRGRGGSGNSRPSSTDSVLSQDSSRGANAFRPKKQAKKPKSVDKNMEIMLAVQLVNDARKILDPTRLLFEAAIKYDDMAISDKATQLFNKCTIYSDAASIVDAYDLPKDLGFNRRMERMADSHRKEFLAKRAKLREDLIFAEEERQRLRAMVSMCQLVRLYLLDDNFPAAHSNIVQSFELTRQVSEHTELLFFMHDVLKEYSNKCFGELSKAQQIVRQSAGPLAEVHLNILHELLEEDARNADVLEWMGRRYNEKLDFDTAFRYYKRARDMRDPVRSGVEMRDMFVVAGDDGKTKETNDAEFLGAISKAETLQFQNPGVEQDVVNERERTDYAWPGKKHEGSTIYLYQAPAQGWTYATRMQQERLERLGLKHKLPDKPFRDAGARGASVILEEDSLVDSMSSSQFV